MLSQKLNMLLIGYFMIFFISVSVIYLLYGHFNFEQQANSKEDPVYLSEVIREWFLIKPEWEKNYSFSANGPYLYGRLGQPSVIDLLYREKTGGFFIECGAWDGEQESNTLLMELVRNWRGLLIEANKQNVVNLLRKHRKTDMLEVCLSMSNAYERIEFLNLNNIGGISSVDEDVLLKQGRGTESKNPDAKTVVQCFPLYAILLAIGNPVVDLFSLDIEGAEIGVLRTLPFDKVNINMFLLEMFHFVGEKEKEIREIFRNAGYLEGPEMFPSLEARNHSVNPNYDIIFYKKGLDIEMNLDCKKFTGGWSGRGYKWGDQVCVGPK